MTFRVYNIYISTFSEGRVMKRIIVCILILLSLVGCKPSPATINRSIAKTQTAMPTNTQTSTTTPTLTPTPTPSPTPTPTPIPLSDIDLSSILMLQGDFPGGYLVDPIGRYTDNPVLVDIKNYEQMVVQTFSKTNEGKGIVALFLFKDNNDRDTAFSIAQEQVEERFGFSTDITDFGDKGFVYYKPVIGVISISAVIFTRCNAFIYVAKSMDDVNSSVIRSYSENLDLRLTELLCNKY